MSNFRLLQVFWKLYSTGIRQYQVLVILFFIISTMYLFRDNRFITHNDLICTQLPQISCRNYSAFPDLWNQYMGMGLPNLPRHEHKYFSILRIYFKYFNARVSYILFLCTGFLFAYMACYYSAMYFYGSKYISVIISLMYVSSGSITYTLTNYQNIEYFYIMPILVVMLHKYITKNNVMSLLIFSILNVYVILNLSILSIASLFLQVNLFIIFFVFDRYKSLRNVLIYLVFLNALMIGLNLFRLTSMVEFYLFETVRHNIQGLPQGLQSHMIIAFYSLNSLFLDVDYPINLHPLYLILIISYLFFKPLEIEKIHLKVFFVSTAIITLSYLAGYYLAESIRYLSLCSIIDTIHFPGTLMIGIGIRSFTSDTNSSKNIKIIITFLTISILYITTYLIFKNIIKVNSVIILGLIFSLFLFVRNIQARKIGLITLLLFYTIVIIHGPIGEMSMGRILTSNTATSLDHDTSDIVNILKSDESMNDKDGVLNGLYRITDTMSNYFFQGIYPINEGISVLLAPEHVIMKRYDNFMRLLADSNDKFLSPLFPLLNVKYVLSDKDVNEVGFKIIGELPKEGIKIYRNNRYLPRIFAVGGCSSYSNIDEFINIIKNNKFDLANNCLIEGPAGGEPHATVNYKVLNLNYAGERISFDLRIDSGGYLIILDNYYPGWKAYVNGEPSTIYPAYLTFKALSIPKSGNYKIILIYSPTFFREGIILSSAICLLLLIYMLIVRSRDNSPDRIGSVRS